MNELVTGIICLVAVLVLFLTGIELAIAMVVIGFLGFAYLVSWEAALNLLAKDFFDVFNTYGFTVVPLFVLMGQVAFNSGIAKRLFDASNKFIGHIPGGLAIATVAGATAFKSICGSSAATAATFAAVAVPEMDRYGYDRKLSTGIVASVGTLGILLPPSVLLIIFGIITDQSIGRLFLAGVFPGLIIAALFVCVIYGWCKLYPSAGPKSIRSSWGERLRCIPEVALVVLIFLLIIFGILKGFFTPTEAGSVGTILVLILVFAKKDLSLKGYFRSVAESARTACMVLLLITGSTVLGHLIAVTNTHDRRRMDRNPAASPRAHYYHHCLHLPLGRLLYRRCGFPDPRHPDLLPGRGKTGLRPPLVRHDDCGYGHDRCGHTACGDMRFRGKTNHKSTDERDLQGCLSILDKPCRRRYPALRLPAARHMAAASCHGEVKECGEIFND